IQECIEQEFGRPTHELFAQLDETPYGAASIGQVHRARLFDGRDVIVKVQYPGVDTAVDSDLAQLKLLAKAKGLIVDKKALDDTFEEIRERMVEELDYEFEAQQCRTFGAMFASFSRVIVPSVVDE